jgi:DNA-binding transcriptional LysR family regulator
MSNLDRLIRFSVVAEEMSFSKAARRLNVDQPWLSRQIQQLEAQMGFPLFVRSTRRVSLTEAGETLFQSARQLVEAADLCRQSTRDLMRIHSQTLALGVNPYSFWVPARKTILDAFQVRHPRVKIDVVSNYTSRLISKLQKRVIDVALIGQPCELAGFETIVLYSCPVSLLVPPGDPLAGERRIPMSALAGREIPVTDPKLNQERWDILYKPFFDAGAIPLIVREGETAVPFYARERRLPVLTVGWPHSEQGTLAEFVHVDFEGDVPQAKYALVRRDEPARGLLDYFWNTARRIVDNEVETVGAAVAAAAEVETLGRALEFAMQESLVA